MFGLGKVKGNEVYKKGAKCYNKVTVLCLAIMHFVQGQIGCKVVIAGQAKKIYRRKL